MEQIPAAEMERVIRVQGVMLQATARKITWWQAAEILGISVGTMRRWKVKYGRKACECFSTAERKRELANSATLIGIGIALLGTLLWFKKSPQPDSDSVKGTAEQLGCVGSF